MIINFTVQNFGSIKDKQTLSFEADKTDKLSDFYVVETNGLRLLKMGLIYGANASGKTTVLKALNFLVSIILQPIDNKTSELGFEPFHFDDITPTQNSFIEIDFIGDVRYNYKVEFNKKAVVREELYHYISNRRSNIYIRTTDLESQFAEIKLGSSVKVDKKFVKTLEANTLWNNTVLGGYLKTNIQFGELKSVTDWFTNCFPPIILPNSSLEEYVTNEIHNNNIPKDDVVGLLKRADLYISDIKTKKIDSEIPNDLFKLLLGIQEQKGSKVNIEQKVSVSMVDFEHTVNNKKYYLPIEEESEGTRRYYGFAGLLVEVLKEGNILLIDEIESSLHPDLLEHFLLMFLKNSQNSQIIATTHFREFLNDRSLYRDDVIWFTNKDENCATELYSLADFDSSVIRDSSNVFNAYKSGKLGGAPNTGDLYIDLEN